MDDQGDTGACVGRTTVTSVPRRHSVNSGLLPGFERLSARNIWMASWEMGAHVSFWTFIMAAKTSIKKALGVERKQGCQYGCHCKKSQKNLGS